jgi:alpha-amylase
VANLPDIRTESTQNVDLPPFDRKWKRRALRPEMKELDAFFKRTGYPKHHVTISSNGQTISLIYGIDGYRADTVKHTEASVWADFKAQSEYAFATWKKNNPTKVRQQPFYSIAEVYNYNISAGKSFDFEIRK